MKLFFLFVEGFVILWMIISIIRKKDLSVVYFPLFSFSYGIVDNTLSSGLILLLIISFASYYVVYNLPFITKNVFAFILVLYFSILVLEVNDFQTVRKSYITAISLFLLIGVVPEIYKKYSKEVILKELSLSALLMLILFIVNASFSTYFNFNPKMMYGISSGVLFGNMFGGGFNFLPLVCFLVFQKAIKEKKLVYFLVFFTALFLSLLTLRRTVMLLNVIGAFLLIINLVEYKNLKKLFGLILGVSLITLVVITSTGFLDTLRERYELRNLDNRNMEEEQRFQEVTLVYKDLFVYFDYSPWFGYGLFDAAGNYGKGVFGGRNLHTDLTVLIHSSGFLGLFLYLGMVGTVFWNVWKKTITKNDYIQFLFLTLVFGTYFITGRYTSIPSTLMIFLILCIPLSKDGTKIDNNSTTKLGEIPSPKKVNN
jgi:O-antigen ligase